MSETPNFENILATIIRESEESLEKAYQAALVGFNQTIKALKESPDSNLTKIEDVTKQNQIQTIGILKEAELKNLQKWKAIVHEIEERREAIINADSKKLNELIEYINKKERHKQDELLELINQSSITNSLNQKEKQP
jgi:hydroxylamine reductase (hybrid-cluster protein)